MKYVVGFLFDTDKENVLLIRKMRPKWQEGKINGIGGKIEANETPIVAIRREFKEEAGLNIKDWKHTVVLTGNDFEVNFFTATGDIFSAKTCTDEQLEVHMLSNGFRHSDFIHNLNYIIPMSLDESLKLPIKLEEKLDAD